jgi:hypothetical protein
MSEDRKPLGDILAEVEEAVSSLTDEDIAKAVREIAQARRLRGAKDEGEEPTFRTLASLSYVRPFTLSGTDDVQGPWASLRENAVPKRGTFCEFGFAEEVIGLLEYADGAYEVGIGESLRPYHRLYFGADMEVASRTFFEAVLENGYSDQKDDDAENV